MSLPGLFHTTFQINFFKDENYRPASGRCAHAKGIRSVKRECDDESLRSLHRG